ncbi:hypothetical protein FNH05_23080 [Amycolatopsis rhizosphaerae]|uniref:Uncharacterized protein n=1 Tax=Amycolatopsis rhizosphaerae TaxID=2053003 RepID=A0A558BX12_9PSEU|nr:hypothetical protein [Amycolatopsis rhizosphaerae]TVT41039.1 hypothetical protein FNH05_23080 [Amycolatopsis rhizosphaerae]
MLVATPATATQPAVPPGAVVGSGDERTIQTQGVYEYEDHSALLHVPMPTQADLNRIATDPAAEKNGTWQHMYAAWGRYLQKQPGWTVWRAKYAEVVLGDAKALDNIPEPSDALMAQVGPVKDAAGNFTYPFKSTFYMLARWKEFKTYPSQWPAWRARYVTIKNNDSRGGTALDKNGFESAYRQQAIEADPTLSQGDWKYGKQLPPELKEQLESKLHIVDRPLDAVDLTKLKMILEFKSGDSIEGNAGREQLQDLIQIAKATGCRLYYVFGKMPGDKSVAMIREEAKAAGIQVPVVYWPALAQPVMPENWEGRSPPDEDGGGVTAPPPSGPTGGPAGGAAPLAGPGQVPADSPLADAIATAPNSDGEAVTQRVANQWFAEQDPSAGVDDSAYSQPDLGGVDFSTLQLRYVSDTYHNGSGVQYAFKADASPAGEQSFGGQAAARLASDSFFTWLELSTDKFWVNLNPDEPDRIIDPQFGTTDAGRVLLQADLQMKKTVARLIHPDTPAGKQFWDAMQGDSPCLQMRNWIVPDTATVRDNGNELYILDTPLRVETESDYIKAPGVGADCGRQDRATTQHNEQVYKTTILPQVQDAVNHAPEYADLRRVYASRVAAEWFRQRSATKHTAYSDLIGKGDISRWRSREPWTPRQVFDQYVQSYKNGEFTVRHTTTEGNTVYTNTYVYGGVDFSRINENKVSAAAFTKDHPDLADAVGGALYKPVQAGGDLWFGGMTSSKPPVEAFAKPSPATSNPLLYPLVALPLAGWLLAGAWLLYRRRRTTAPDSSADGSTA